MATVASLTAAATRPAPKFFGLVRGEMLKLTHQRTTWIGALLLFGACSLRWLTVPLIPSSKLALQNNAAGFVHQLMEQNLSVSRAFIGFFIIVLTARAIGLDYQQGTIRIILARGVERTQLLAAKLLTVATASLVTLIALLAYLALLGTIFIGLTAGNLNALSMLSSNFWPDTWTYILTILISMAATLMLATAASVIGKSLSFGLSVGLLFFPADNIGATVGAILYQLTNNDFWLKISAYLLGPNLNVLPSVLLPLTTRTTTLENGTTVVQQVRAFSLGTTPYVNYDATHSLVVIALYTLAFAIVAFVVTRQRDVLE